MFILKNCKIMEFVNLKLVLVIFGSYKDISPNNIDFLKHIVDHTLSNGYMPSTIDELSFNLDSSGTKTSNEKRLAINKMDNSTSLRILADRIEVEYRNNNFTPAGTNSYNPSAKIVFKDAVNLVKLIEEFYSGTTHNRLGLIATYVLSKENSTKVSKNFSSKANIGNEELVEWNQKTVIRKQINIKKSPEMLNVSKDISFGMRNIVSNNKQAQKLSEVVIDLDINTIPEKTNSRFKFEDVKSFIDVVLPLQDSIMDEILSSNQL